MDFAASLAPGKFEVYDFFRHFGPNFTFFLP
jgi:hypothetical protein